MRKRLWYVVGMVTATALVAGCIEKRVDWSPDGSRAAVIGYEGALYLSDGNGHLSKRIAPSVIRVAWFPDSRQLLLLRNVEAKTWDELADLIGPESSDRLAEAARQMSDDLLAFDGDLDDFKPEIGKQLSHGEMVAVLVYMREYLADVVREKLGDKWDDLKDLSAEVQTLQIAEVRGGGARLGAIVFQTLDGIDFPRVSPDGAFVAVPIMRDTDGADMRRLVVMPTDEDAELFEVAKLVGQHVDWSTDGTSVVFARANLPIPEGSEALRLGAVSQREIRDAAGELLEEFGKVQDLAGIIFDDTLKLRVLPDDRVLFAASDVRLPATAKEMPQRQSLFAVDLYGGATVTRVLPRETESELASNLGHFEVSPDGTRISVPTDHGGVAVVELATGEVVYAQPEPDPQDKLRSVPSWRSDDELCFVVPADSEYGSPQRAEVVLWSAGRVRAISKSWPKSVVKDFLTPEENKEAGPAEESPAPVEP